LKFALSRPKSFLAIKSAVETARAGEAGAGFAVVAAEVRNLAIRFRDAAKDTTELIEKIVGKIINGYEFVEKTHKTFIDVRKTSSKVGKFIEEIAQSSNEQAKATQEVNSAVTEMNEITHQYAAHSEEASSTAENMHEHSRQLKQVVKDLEGIVKGNHKKPDSV